MAQQVSGLVNTFGTLIGLLGQTGLDFGQPESFITLCTVVGSPPNFSSPLWGSLHELHNHVSHQTAHVGLTKNFPRAGAAPLTISPPLPLWHGASKHKRLLPTTCAASNFFPQRDTFRERRFPSLTWALTSNKPRLLDRKTPPSSPLNKSGGEQGPCVDRCNPGAYHLLAEQNHHTGSSLLQPSARAIHHEH